MSCRRSAVINVSTLGASLGKMPESFHIAQLFAYRSSKVNIWRGLAPEHLNT